MMKLFSAATILSVTVILFMTNVAGAVSAKSFQAGRIIDDSVMTDKRSMSVSQIQSFLNSKMPSCDTNGSKMYSSTQTRKQYAASRGVSTPFICLKSYSESGKSAAQIIYDKSQKYTINPQVLIVLLEKEQGLVTDDWPWPVQYRTATGYGCPDTAPCDSQYYGLSNQLDWSAKMFRAIIDRNPNWYSPYIAGYNSQVYWHPDTARCGSKPLTIENWSTAGLYSYTPYQPNQAALNAGYGTGDSCSSYGNRNFYLYFNDWFGSTMGTPFFRINEGKTVYMEGLNNSFYRVDSPAKLEAYGWNKSIFKVISRPSGYTSGKENKGVLPLIARFEGNAVYAIDRGYRHSFPNREMLNSYGYEVGDEAQLPNTSFGYYKEHSPMRSIAVGDANKTYLIGSAKKRYFNGPSAYKSGSPAYSTLPGTGLSDYFLSKVANGAKIYAPGDLVRIGSSPSVYMVMSATERIIIPSRGIMNDYGFSFNSVSSIPTQYVADYTVRPDNLDVIVKSSTGAISVVGPKGSAYSVTPQLIQEKYTFINPANLLIVPPRVTGILSSKGNLTDLIRAEGEDTVYIVDNGTRKSVRSREQLTSLGHNMDHVSDVSKLFSNKIPIQ